MNQAEHIQEHIELAVVPIPPDTLASVKAELQGEIEAALRETGHEGLLTDGQIQFEIEQPFPTDEVIIVGFTLLSGMALEVFKATVIPRLKKRFEVRQRQKPKGKSGKARPAKK
jgi:hypothetical protein